MVAVLTASPVNASDAYGNTDNASLYVVSRASEYLSTLKQALADVRMTEDSMPLCLYTAGVDGHEEAERGLPGMTADVLAEPCLPQEMSRPRIVTTA